MHDVHDYVCVCVCVLSHDESHLSSIVNAVGVRDAALFTDAHEFMSMSLYVL